MSFVLVLTNLIKSTREFAGQLVKDCVTNYSLAFWHHADFRTQINFSGLNPKQQDTVFNELEVTALVCVILSLEERLLLSKGSRDYVAYANTAELVIGEFIDLLARANVSPKNLVLWEELINSRLKEYRKDMRFILKESRDWQSFKGSDRLLRATWARVITLSVNSMRRIKVDDTASLDDPLWPLLRRWLIGLEVDIIKNIESSDLRNLNILN